MKKDKTDWIAVAFLVVPAIFGIIIGGLIGAFITTLIM